MLDYAILFGIVATILFAFSSYIRRGIQGMVRTVSDQIGPQEGADQRVNRERGDGYLISSFADVDLASGKDSKEYVGSFNYHFDDKSTVRLETVSNLGFSERDR